MAAKNENRLQYLRPDEIQARLKETPVVYVPVGSLEWHGPHMVYGTDAINAEAVSLRACRKTGGIVWPTQWLGTERERGPEVLESLGFRDTGEYVVGMDFPKNAMVSMYAREEVFATVMREILRLVGTLGAKYAVVVNGHGAENQIATLERLAREISETTELTVVVRFASSSRKEQNFGKGHAGVGETSLMMHLVPGAVDMKRLPAGGKAMKFTDYAVAPGRGFAGEGPTDGKLTDDEDPRLHASEELGKAIVESAGKELAAAVKEMLGGASGKRRGAGRG